MGWLRASYWEWRGRLDRRALFALYLFGGVILFLILFAITIIRMVLGEVLGLGDDTILWQKIANGAFHVTLFLPLSSLLTRRVHDVGLPGWPILALILAIGALSLWSSTFNHVSALDWGGAVALLGLLALALAWPGQAGENRFGPPTQHRL